MIRVLMAEDSRTVRSLITQILESDPEIRVVGTASDGAEAVEMAERLRPDLITMDIHMPVMDGFEATRQIMARAPAPILIISSTARREDVQLSLRATQLGAVMVLPTPVGPGSPDFERQSAELVSMARAMSGVKVVRRWDRSPAAPEPRRVAASRASSPPVQLVAIAASTGGPAALQQILAALPASFPAPVLVVQHIARGFAAPLVEWLDSTCPPRVRLAADGERPVPGTVYLAPDDAHLTVAPGGAIALSDSAPIGGFRPSGSALFESVGRMCGTGAAAVILTGMGDDGVAGLRTAHARGVRVIAQDEASSVVHGMPREAVRAGVADEVLPLSDIAARLMALAGMA
jgi:two-component system chemotaxis response regulator CheB